MDENLEKLYQKAELLRRHKKWDEAIAVCTKIISLGRDPERKAGAYNERGLAYYFKENYDRAIADYDKAIKLNPHDAAAYRRRGLAYYAKEDYDRAIADYDKALELNPHDAAAYSARGLAYYAKEDYDCAIADYDKALELNPHDAAAYGTRSLAYGFKGDYDRALADCDKALELNPTDTKAYNARGRAYYFKRDYDRALADCDKALELNPTNAAAYANRGLVYCSKRDYDRALADYDKALELNPTYAEAYSARGSVYLDTGDYDRALADCDKVLELNPTDAAAYRNRGFVFLVKGDSDRALADYDKATELNPTDATAYTNRGVVFMVKGDHDRALADYHRALELNPTYATAYSNLGAAYCIMGNYASALDNYLKAGSHGKGPESNDLRVYLAFWLEGITSDREERGRLFEPYCKLADAIQGINTKLFCKLTDDEAVAHYTSLHGLRALAERRSPFRLYNSAYMNDREEGQVFFEIMKKEKEENGIDVESIFYNRDAESPRSSSAYIGSFVKIESQDDRENGKLSMWRTYGKHNNEEAVGACLIFNKDQFAQYVPSNVPSNVPSKIGAMSQPQENGAKRGKSTSQNGPPPLYNVIYKSDIRKLSKSLKKLTSSLKKVQKLLRRHKEHEKTLIELVRVLLDSIRFLFKTDHYSEEKEVRVIRMSYDTGGKNPPECKVATEQLPPRFYLNIPGNVRFSGVILGPGTHGVSEWQHYLGDGIAVRKSDIKFGKIHQ